MLCACADFISVPFSDDDEDHVQVLREYWELCFPGEPFQRKSKRWQDAGFQVRAQRTRARARVTHPWC